jgi:hypothetical protein
VRPWRRPRWSDPSTAITQYRDRSGVITVE